MKSGKNNAIAFGNARSGRETGAPSGTKSNGPGGVREADPLPPWPQSLLVFGLLAFVAAGCWMLYTPSILQMARLMAWRLFGIALSDNF